MTTEPWSGATVRKARAYWRARLPFPCCRCGRPVTNDQAWHVDHYPVPRELGGTQTWPAHAACNTSAGGKRGAAITNARRAAPRLLSERERGIRGI